MTSAAIVMGFPGSPQKAVYAEPNQVAALVSAGWIANPHAMKVLCDYVNSDEGAGVQASLGVLPTDVLMDAAEEFQVPNHSGMTRTELVQEVLRARGYLDSVFLQITSITTGVGLALVLHGSGFDVRGAGTPTVVAGVLNTEADSVTVVNDGTVNVTLNSDSGHTSDVIDISITTAYGTFTFLQGYTVP